MPENLTHMSALGNDFIVIDAISYECDISKIIKNELKILKKNMPFDQILCLLPPKNIHCDVYLEIYNEDGSQSENCVNGLRCIGRYMQDHNLAFNEKICVQLVNQITKVKKIDKENYEVILEQFSLDPEDIGLKKIKSDSYSFIHDQEQINFYSISVGNPHAIIFAQEISTIKLDALAQSLKEENCYINGFNLNLAEISSNNCIKLRVYERGVGETGACGSGACATALAATLFKGMQQDIEIKFEKGTLNLKIDLDSNKIYLRGTTSYLY
jgi:diaminopimelate epimerase